MSDRTIDDCRNRETVEIGELRAAMGAHGAFVRCNNCGLPIVQCNITPHMNYHMQHSPASGGVREVIRCLMLKGLEMRFREPARTASMPLSAPLLRRTRGSRLLPQRSPLIRRRRSRTAPV